MKRFIRIFLSMVGGASMLFFVQMRLYESGNIPLEDTLGDWLPSYRLSASLIFLVSSITTLIWFLLISKNKNVMPEDALKKKLYWWVLMIFPIAVAFASVFIINPDETARGLLLLFFGLDIFLLYWFPTAIGSFGAFTFVPPGSLYFRSLLGDR